MRALANVFHLGIKEFRSLQRDYAMLLLIAWAFSLGVYSSATGLPETLHNAPLRWWTRTVRSFPPSLSMPSSRRISARRR